jgi:hypothetical protein
MGGIAQRIPPTVFRQGCSASTIIRRNTLRPTIHDFDNV